ncbi:MAG: RNA methyltransferase [Clostridiales bacterium]|nr:RNA methyltransferase [Candidatus Apopatousia equi]
MESIISKSNPKIMLAMKIKQKKFRNQEHKILLEGHKIIDEAVNFGLKIEFLLGLNEKDLIGYKNFDCYLITEKICKELSSTVNSQNVFAVVSFEDKKFSEIKDRVLVLDGLQNPDNLGAIIRSAVATNFTQIFAINSVDKFNEKVIRASMGNVFKIEFIETTYDNLFTFLKDYEIIIADMDGKDVFKEKSFPKKLALVIGNEGNGVSKEIESHSTMSLSIPMENSVESLNASVSAGILMYQIYNKGV